jgi:hypothetical protein
MPSGSSHRAIVGPPPQNSAPTISGVATTPPENPAPPATPAKPGG